MIKVQKGTKGLSYPLSEFGYRIALPEFYRAQGALRKKLANRLAQAAGACNNKKVKSVEPSCNDRIVYINGYALKLELFD